MSLCAAQSPVRRSRRLRCERRACAACGAYTGAFAQPFNVELWRASPDPLSRQPDPISSKRARGGGGEVRFVLGPSAAGLVQLRSGGSLATPDRTSTEPISALAPRRMRSGAPSVCTVAYGAPRKRPRMRSKSLAFNALELFQPHPAQHGCKRYEEPMHTQRRSTF